MKYWFGYPVHECECGFSTPDEDEFNRHLIRKKHKRKEEPKPVPAKKQDAKPAEDSAEAKKAAKAKEEENA